MSDLPTGTITFLMTDVEGSGPLWERDAAAMEPVVARYTAVAIERILALGGAIVRTRGENDSIFAVFERASDAVAAATAFQRELVAQELCIQVRVGMNTGEAQLREGDYYGTAVNRCARVRALGHGGQILLAGSTGELAQDRLPGDTSLLSLGQHRLKDLQRPEPIYQVRHPDLPAEFPPLKSLNLLPNNLPQQLNSFIGREREMAEIASMLLGDGSHPAARLVTITGPGGGGKTRIALQIAADLLDVYPDGVWLVKLAPVAERSLVPQAVAAALGVREEPGRSLPETLREYLGSRRLLLVVDNCEHVVSAVAPLVHDLLRACAGPQILATSREPLGIAGETIRSLPSLSLPDPAVGRQISGGGAKEGDSSFDTRHPTPDTFLQSDAVRLFTERARQSEPRFALTASNAPAVAQVCRRLDGLPLAIELAAARARVLAVEQIAARLDDRFRLLTSGTRGVEPRQQTLRAAIDWSYDLLSEAERVLLARLSIFAGGFTLEAAEAVCGFAAAPGSGLRAPGWDGGTPRTGRLRGSPGSSCSEPGARSPEPGADVLDLLAQLVDKSLVVAEETEDGVRYRLLETIRQYGAEKLERADETLNLRQRHRDWFLRLTEESDPELTGASEEEWLDRLEREHDNLRAALATALELGPSWGDPSVPLRFSVALWRFWYVRGYWSEGRERLAQALALEGREGNEPTPAQMALRAKALRGTATLAKEQGDYAAARRDAEESLGVERERGEPGEIAAALMVLGHIAWAESSHAEARALYEESAAIDRERGDRAALARSLANLGKLAISANDYDTAMGRYQECVALLRALGDRRATARMLANLAFVADCRGDAAAARVSYEESLALCRELDFRSGVASALSGLARVDDGDPDPIRRRTLLEEALAIERELGDRRSTTVTLNDLGDLAFEQEEYAAARAFYEESLAIARELNDTYGIAYELHNLGSLARAEGDAARASALLRESMALHRRLEDRRGIAEDLESLAALFIDAQASATPVRWMAVAETLRDTMSFPLTAEGLAERDRCLASAREALGEESFATAWADGQSLTWEETVAEALREREDP